MSDDSQPLGLLDLHGKVREARAQLTLIRVLLAVCLLVIVFAILGILAQKYKGFTRDRIQARLDIHLPSIESQVRHEFVEAARDLHPELEVARKRLEKSAPIIFDALAEEGRTLLVDMRKLPDVRLQVAVDSLVNNQRQRLAKEFPDPKDRAKIDQMVSNLRRSLMTEARLIWKSKTDPRFEVLAKLSNEVEALKKSGAMDHSKAQGHLEKLEPHSIMELIMQSFSIRTP